MPEIRLEIRDIPPSVGTYNGYRVVSPRNGKPFVQCYPTEAAKAWKKTVAAIAAGQRIRGSTYSIRYVVFTKDARRQDVDNWAKVLIDSLVEAGVIDDDSRVSEVHAYKRMDRLNPRTVVVVKTEQEQMFA